MSVTLQHATLEPIGGMVDPVGTDRIEGRAAHRVSGILAAFAASSLIWGLVAWGIGSGFAAITR